MRRHGATAAAGAMARRIRVLVDQEIRDRRAATGILAAAEAEVAIADEDQLL